MTPRQQKILQTLVTQALQILATLGVPLTDLTPRRKEKMAKAFLAVAGLKPGMAWSEVKDNNDAHQLQSRQVIAFMNAHLGEDISSGSYDDIRRKDLALPEQALIVLKSAKNPDANTNDGTRGFALNPVAAHAVRQFGTPNWQSLSAQLRRDRGLARIPVRISDGTSLSFSPGKHNILQKEIIENFLPIFGFGAEVLYVGDTANKSLFVNQEKLSALQFFELAHDKLPDVVAYSETKNWLYLIEAVTTANPITELRRKALLDLTTACTADVIFITAFPDRATYRTFAKDIAWETEVWIADAPEHMIHFNGDKFLGPYHKGA
jgi:BsuBI/PstI restriction endonuclease domain/BsuBI/PstI restriction endonuclease HTH domain